MMTRSQLPLWLIMLSLPLAALTGCETAINGGPEAELQRQIDRDLALNSDRPPTAYTLHAMARLMADQKRNEEAVYVWKRLLDQYPDFIPAYSELAELYVREQRMPLAMETLDQGLAIAPGDPVLNNNMGVCLLMRKDYELALGAFDRAAKADPGQARYHANCATAHGLLARYDEALEAFKQYMAEGAAYHNVALLCEANGDIEEARRARAEARERGFYGRSY